jgi:integrase
MSQKLSDTIVKRLPIPESGNRITYDSEVAGFGARVTAANAKAFILNYRTRAGRERRYTIGSFPEWGTAAARKHAIELRKQIAVGEDPLAEIEAGRDAKTVADLCARYLEDHAPKKRSQAADVHAIDAFILPAMKHLKVADVTFSDIDGLHRKITKNGKPIRANRVVALLSKMFSLAIKWQWRTGNPAAGIEKNPEEKRERYLSGAELEVLTKALAEHEDQQAANIIRLLLLTGARRGEVLSATWDQFDLTEGVWTKPSSHTKQKKSHRVPLSAPARQLLDGIPQEGPYVFPGLHQGHREGVRKAWAAICQKTGISDCTIHDLRHTYASVLASKGLSLHLIGALLGHTKTATTARYAHLSDDPLRQATETAGAIITGKPSAEIRKHPRA